MNRAPTKPRPWRVMPTECKTFSSGIYNYPTMEALANLWKHNQTCGSPIYRAMVFIKEPAPDTHRAQNHFMMIGIYKHTLTVESDSPTPPR